MSLRTDIPSLAERINSMEGLTEMLHRIHHNEKWALTSRSEQIMRAVKSYRLQHDLIRGAEMMGYIVVKHGDGKGGSTDLYLTDAGRKVIGVERPFGVRLK